MQASNSQRVLTHSAQPNEAIASLQPATSCKASTFRLQAQRPHALPPRRNCPCCSAHFCLCTCAFASECPAADTHSICRSFGRPVTAMRGRAALIGLEAVGYREHVRGCSLGFVQGRSCVTTASSRRVGLSFTSCRQRITFGVIKRN